MNIEELRKAAENVEGKRAPEGDAEKGD